MEMRKGKEFKLSKRRGVGERKEGEGLEEERGGEGRGREGRVGRSVGYDLTPPSDLRKGSTSRTILLNCTYCASWCDSWVWCMMLY